MAGKYQPYSEYKSFETVFLKLIPSLWEIKPLYSLCDFRQGKAHEPFVDEDGEYIYVNSRFVSTGGQALKYCTENLTPANQNDILMVMSDLPNGRALAKAFHVGDDKKYAVNQRVCAITAHKIHVKFLYYQLNRSPYFLMYDDGSNQTNLSNEAFRKYPVLVPTLSEQETIANFLDHETAKIDTLIEKQQQLIKLLKEKRQAVISHAVTKGLNPNAPMRDSGVEWLGEVPKHWDFCLIKHKCAEITDGAHVSPETKGGEHFFVSITDIKKGVINFKNALLTSTSSYRYLIKTGCMPFPGDILFSKDGTIGQTAITPEGIDFVVASSLIIIRPNREKVRPQFLDFLLQSGVVVEQVESFVKGAALRRLSIQNLLKIGGTFPPINEQDDISDYLQDTLERYDELEKQANDMIVLQKERRTALISAAVTGKIDVRGWLEN